MIALINKISVFTEMHEIPEMHEIDRDSIVGDERDIIARARADTCPGAFQFQGEINVDGLDSDASTSKKSSKSVSDEKFERTRSNIAGPIPQAQGVDGVLVKAKKLPGKFFSKKGPKKARSSKIDEVMSNPIQILRIITKQMARFQVHDYVQLERIQKQIRREKTKCKLNIYHLGKNNHVKNPKFDFCWWLLLVHRSPTRDTQKISEINGFGSWFRKTESCSWSCWYFRWN